MSLFGPQLAFTLIIATFLSKLTPIWSFGRYYLRKGYRICVPPTFSQLRQIGGVSAFQSGKKNKRKNTDEEKDNDDGSFTIPRNTDIPLRVIPLSERDLVSLPFSNDITWLVDISVASVIVYICTELFLSWAPPAFTQGLNLSLVWLLISSVFALLTLVSVVSLHFGSDSSDVDKTMYLIGFFFFLLLAMAVLVIPEDILDLGLKESHVAFSEAAVHLLKSQWLQVRPTVSLVGFKCSLVFVGAFLGSLMLFPGLRYARLHWAAMRQANSIVKLFLHIDILLPIIAASLSLKSFVKDRLTQRTSVYVDVSGPFKFRFTPQDVDTLQIYVFITCILSRLLLTRTHLQAHLDLAPQELQSLTNQHARVEAKKVRQKVLRLYMYHCLAGVQYIAPALLLLMSVLMLKTMGGLCWLGSKSDAWFPIEIYNATVNSSVETPNEFLGEDYISFLSSCRQIWSLFPPVVMRGLLGFFVWWCNLTFLLSALLGSFHYGYFTD